MFKLLFYHFQVTNSKLKTKKFPFEFHSIVKLLFFHFRVTKPIASDIGNSILLLLYQLKVIKRGKLVSFFGHSQNKIIFTSYQSLFSAFFFSRLNLLVTRKPGTRNLIFSLFVYRKHWLTNQLMVSLLN